MYRIVRVLNNNALLVIDQKTGQEKIYLGKGIGFCKKSNEVLKEICNAKEYALTSDKIENQTVNTIEPVYLEAAGVIIEEAETVFGYINRGILLLLAEHISFAVKRIEENIHIDNPFISDIKVVFMQEYMVAQKVKEKLERLTGYEMSEGEMGFIALHIHSGLVGEAVSETLRNTQIIDHCMQIITQKSGCRIFVDSLTYNRLVTHLYYMLDRVKKNEAVKLELNCFIRKQYPESWGIAKEIYAYIESSLHKKIDEQEIGFLAIYIERLRME